MKYFPKNTLVYFNAAPQHHRYDVSDMPVEVFAKANIAYVKDCGLKSPNKEALDFYALNHCSLVISKMFTPNEPLPDWAEEIMNGYMEQLSGQGLRMLHYIMAICAREMRHLKAKPLHFVEKQGLEMAEFVDALTGHDENGAVKLFRNNPPKVTVGKYITAMAIAFDCGKWGSGFGGKKWGEVAHACESFIHGKSSLEMLVDTGFTLAHNNGPIFNKGMMYSTYDHYFNTILDVQRSGQIPELMLDPDYKNVADSEVAKKFVNLLYANKPEEFRGWVDWVQVQKWGVGTYPTFIAKQQVKHPKVAPSTPIIEKVAGMTVKNVEEWFIAPGQSVKKFERIAV